MERNDEAEARLKELAELVLKNHDMPIAESDVSLIQAFIVWGLGEPSRPGKREVDSFFRSAGPLGWLLAKVFGGQIRKHLQQSAEQVLDSEHSYRANVSRLTGTLYLRSQLINNAAYAREHIRREAQDEGKAILDKASKAASKARDKTVKELRELLLLGRTLLLRKELLIAQECQMTEVATLLRQDLDECYQVAMERLGDISTITEELSRFDATIDPNQIPKK